MKIIVCRDKAEMSAVAASMVEAQIKEKPETILGLATGSTPEGMYAILCQKYAEGALDFSKVKTFNLDEYYPIKKDNDQSYAYFMNKHLFSHINVPAKNIHIPNGECADPNAEGPAYDAMVAAEGGVDLQILGIGRNGHIAFNEPDEALIMGTHLTSLTESTIEANSRFFASKDDVPRHALTMGIGTIMTAKKIILMANGADKKEALSYLFNDKLSAAVPASLLKLHTDVTVICDEAACPDSQR